uniref:Rhomboid domain-containing protein n=1 Tax=Macrostomum lignano TaxID=282301 RepID=A0A1I8FPZ7_9PLAT
SARLSLPAPTRGRAGSLSRRPPAWSRRRRRSGSRGHRAARRESPTPLRRRTRIGRHLCSPVRPGRGPPTARVAAPPTARPAVKRRGQLPGVRQVRRWLVRPASGEADRSRRAAGPVRWRPVATACGRVSTLTHSSAAGAADLRLLRPRPSCGIRPGWRRCASRAHASAAVERLPDALGRSSPRLCPADRPKTLTRKASFATGSRLTREVSMYTLNCAWPSWTIRGKRQAMRRLIVGRQEQTGTCGAAVQFLRGGPTNDFLPFLRLVGLATIGRNPREQKRERLDRLSRSGAEVTPLSGCSIPAAGLGSARRLRPAHRLCSCPLGLFAWTRRRKPQLRLLHGQAAAASLLGLAFSGIYTGAGVTRGHLQEAAAADGRAAPSGGSGRQRATLRLVLPERHGAALRRCAGRLPACRRLLHGLAVSGNSPKTLALIAAVGFALNVAYCAAVATAWPAASSGGAFHQVAPTMDLMERIARRAC